MLSGRRTREHSCLASVLVLCNLISISHTVDCTPAGCTLCAKWQSAMFMGVAIHPAPFPMLVL